MPYQQASPGQERPLDALQARSQFAHVLKLQTSRPFDGKYFFIWSFEFELMMEGAQILGFFDGSLPYPIHGTQYDKQQYTYQSMMAYTILLRNITPNQQQNIRSYRGYGNSAELAYNHLKNLYQATDSVNQSRLMAQLTIVEMKPAKKEWRISAAVANCAANSFDAEGRYRKTPSSQLSSAVLVLSGAPLAPYSELTGKYPKQHSAPRFTLSSKTWTCKKNDTRRRHQYPNSHSTLNGVTTTTTTGINQNPYLRSATSARHQVTLAHTAQTGSSQHQRSGSFDLQAVKSPQRKRIPPLKYKPQQHQRDNLHKDQETSSVVWPN
ncbi:unnamed protein product [Closterium sp. Yama58-4]|nr:unnamed protein product [Closterium sp. Yama58-4]